MVTQSGLTFIGAAQDRYLRAFATATGEPLWQARLPAGGNAAPMTYIAPQSGRQFVVIAAGGHDSIRAEPGDFIQAFAIPLARALKRPPLSKIKINVINELDERAAAENGKEPQRKHIGAQERTRTSTNCSTGT